MPTGLSSTYDDDEFCPECGNYYPDHDDTCPTVTVPND